ncbi:MAG: putative Ig domain-containing protein [Pirellulales bacterium]
MLRFVGGGSWELLNADQSQIRWGSGDAILNSTQYVFENLNQVGRPDDLSQPGDGELPAGVYYLRLLPTAGLGQNSLKIIDPNTSSHQLQIGTPFSGNFDPSWSEYLGRFDGQAGQVINFNPQYVQGSSSGGSVYYGLKLISPSGEVILDFDYQDEEPATVVLPLDGSYLLLVTPTYFDNIASNSENQFTIETTLVRTLNRPEFGNHQISVGTAVSSTLTDLKSERWIVPIAQGDQIYFDGLDADARVRTDFYDADGSLLFSLKSSQLNRMLPMATYSRTSYLQLEPIDLIAKDNSNQIGGGGFRPGAFPIIITTADNGSRYRVDLGSMGCAETSLRGFGGSTGELAAIVGQSYDAIQALGCSHPSSNYQYIDSDPLVPSDDVASVQDALTALNRIGAMVVGVGTGPITLPINGVERPISPGNTLAELARLTGAVNQSNVHLSNNIPGDDIAPGEPLYVALGNNQPIVSPIADAITAALIGAGQQIDVVLTDRKGVAQLTSPNQLTLNPQNTATVDVSFHGDGQAHEFYLEFLRHGTSVVLGRIPIGINYSYNYDVDAIDPDGDEITYSLQGESYGASIDPLSGVISWLPAASGKFTFTVQANDGRGGIDTQLWTVDVDLLNQGNRPPVVEPISDQKASANRAFSLQVNASDPDNDSLRYQLTSGLSGVSLPQGMSIDPLNGTIRWTPQPEHVGCPVSVRVLVNDGRGGEASEVFVITIDSGATVGNFRPTISSQPGTIAVVGQSYLYNIIATDRDGDPLSYSLLRGPTGMTLNDATHQVAFNQTNDSIGSHVVTILVHDGRGGTANQSFTLRVVPPNSPPEFLNVEPLFAELSTTANPNLWQFSPEVFDPNGDLLEMTLVTRPNGMTINNGIVNWLPTTLGNFSFTLQADDKRGGKTTQQYFVQVVMDLSDPPKITSRPQGPAVIGSEWSYDVVASDSDSQQLYFRLIDPPEGLRITPSTSDPKKAKIQWTPAGLSGNYQVQVRVTDDALGINGTTQEFSLPVTNLNQPPKIESIPYDAMVGVPWTYAIKARDPDGDQLSYTLLVKQPGMTIDTAGVIRWTPNLSDHERFGSLRTTDPVVVLKISDGHGGETTDEVFARVVASVDDGLNPFVTNNPTGPVFTNQDWTHQLTVFDPQTGSTQAQFEFKELRYNGGVVGLGNSGITQAIRDAIHVSSSGLLTIQSHSLDSLIADQTIKLDDPAYDIVVKVTSTQPSTPPALREYAMQMRFREWSSWPHFVNEPNKELQVGLPFNFTSQASPSVNNSTLSYQWIATPVMSNWFNSNVVSFTLNDSTRNSLPLVIEVTNGSKASDGQTLIRTRQATTLIATQHDGASPTITSHPKVAIVLENEPTYEYQVVTPNSGVTYSLPTAPAGMAFDPQTPGLIRWKPTKVGNYPVQVDVTDSEGRTSSQQFNISAIKPFLLNEPPVISSTPTGPAARDAAYHYQVVAADANWDQLEYTLLEKPDWLSIDPVTGYISGTPKVAGRFPVEVQVTEVSDDAFSDTQWYELVVLQNAPPRITPPTQNSVFQIASGISIPIDATDPNAEDQGNLVFELVDPPAGITISDTNKIVVAPNSLSLGKHYVTAKVTDLSGDSDTALFTLQALQPQNHAPDITSQFRTTLPAGLVYSLELAAIDPDGDDVSFSLESVPPGMRLEQDSVIVWTPPYSRIGNVTVSVSAKSSRDNLVNTESFTFEVTSDVRNSAPQITTIPKHSATVGYSYRYEPAATDSDRDVLTWQLEQHPDGMSINARTGAIQWTPKLQDVGNHQVVIAAIDGYGGRTRQQIDLVVRASNIPPLILASPPPPAFVEKGKQYSYQVVAVDQDENDLYYSIESSDANGMAINATSGLLTWVSQNPHGSLNKARIVVTDSRGAKAFQDIAITTFDATINSPPVIVQGLPKYWIIGGSSSFQVFANDQSPGSTTLTYHLKNPPNGMSINSTTGVIAWQPTDSDQGNHTVTLEITDGEFYARQSQQIVVRRNAPPSMDSIGNKSITGGQLLEVVPKATDGDNDLLSYSLTTTPSLVLPFDSKTGTIHWLSPSVTTSVSYVVTISVDDGFGGIASRSFQLTVLPDSTPPVVTVNANPGLFEANKSGQLSVSAVDDVGVQFGSLTLTQTGFRENSGSPWTNDPISIDLNSAGRASRTYALPGQYRFMATAKDRDNNLGTTEFILHVAPDATAPDIVINSPVYNQTVYEPIEVHGSITDTNNELSEYWVTLFPNSNPSQEIEVTRGTKEIKNATIASIDTTLLDNGLWYVNVFAKDTHGNVGKKAIPLNLAGTYKPGMLSLSFTDLNLATPDVPLKVQRSYNSSRSDKSLDFGFGWSLDFGIPKVDVSYQPGANLGSNGFPVLLDGTRVTVTLSDGTQEGFTFQPYPEHPNMLGISVSWLPYFIPDKDNTTFLEVEKTSLYRVANSNSFEYISFSGGQSYHPAAAEFGGSWKLYLQSGTKINIHGRDENTAWIEDRNGNRSTITPNGIEHWSGRSIRIVRDQAHMNRITQVVDALGATINYGYDTLGNLTSVTDRMGQTITLAYLSPTSGQEHLLTSITDAAQRQQLVASYSSEKRLSELEDVEHWSTSYGYDIKKRSQSIDPGSDGAANNASVVMDRMGNPVKTVDAVGVQVRASYDKDGILLQQRQVVGVADSAGGIQDDLLTTYTNNKFGQPIAVTDSRGLSTQYVYDDILHLPTTVISDVGIPTSYQYDSKGNLLRVSNINEATTSLNYASRGQISQVKNGDGLVMVTNSYDQLGNLVSATDSYGHKTSFEYNRNGRQTAKIVESKTASGGPMLIRSETQYDLSERVIATSLHYLTKDSIGNWVDQLQWETSTEYDPESGLVTKSTDQHGLQTEFFYDRRGNQILVLREVEIRTPADDETFSVSTVKTAQWTVYDEQGRVLLSTDTIQANATIPATSPQVAASKTLYDQAGRVVGTQRLKNVVVKVVDAAGNPPDSVNFDNYHQLSSHIETEGILLSSTKTIYDSAGRAIRNRDANGLWSETYYGFSGEVVQSRSQAKNEIGQVVWLVSRTAYDDLGRAFISTDSTLEGTQFASGTYNFYDNQSRTIQVERRDGMKLTLLDRYGAAVINPQVAEGPFSVRVDNQGVDTSGNIQLISRSTSEFNAKGQLVRSVSGIGPGHTGVETLYEYDSLGRQFRQIGAAVQTVESSTPLRLVSETSYDSEGRAYKSTTNIRGRDVGNSIVFDTQFAESTTQVYDNLGRVDQTILPDGSTTGVTFDSWGNTVSETDVGGRTKQFEFDRNGRVVAVTLPAVADPFDSDGDGKSGLDAPRFDYAYDWSGNQTVIQDSLNRRTMFTFDSAGRQLTRTLPSGLVESFAYNDLGQQTRHTSFEGVITENDYDNGVTNLPDGTVAPVGTGRLKEQLLFDPAFSTTQAKQVIKYKYDSYGRKLSTELLERESPNALPQTIRLEKWSYSPQGQLVQQTTPEGTINYSYDKVTGAKVRMWTTNDPVNLLDAIDDTRYEYNSIGWLTKIIVVKKNGQPLSDSAHSTPTLSDDPEVTIYGHDLRGREMRMEMPNGVLQTTEVDKVGNVTRMRQYAPDRTPWDLGDNPKLAEYRYTTVDGLRTQLVETFWLDDDNNAATANVPRTTTYDWFYDDNSRLTEERIDSFDESVDRKDTYIMDLFGNRLRKTTGPLTGSAVDQVINYDFDGNDRLLSELLDNGGNGSIDKTTTYTWNGTQQASKTVSVPSQPTVIQEFSYNLKGMLSSVVTTTETLIGGVGTITSRTKVDYGYTSMGIRRIAIDWNDANLDGTFAASEKSGSTEYLIDSSNFTGYAQTIAETNKNGSGQVTKRIVYTFGTDEITQTTTDYSGGLPSASTILHFGHDAHGSVRVLYNAATVIAQVYTYAAYGELIALHNSLGSNLTSQASPLTSVLYNGESFDSRIGQLYLRARWYDMHRFTTLDPYAGNAQDPLSFNKYGFVHANPVTSTDPSGLFGLGGMVVSIGSMQFGNAMNRAMVFTGRQMAIAGIETSMELVIGKLIEAVVGIKFDIDGDEVSRSLTTNFASNMLTAGFGNKTKIAVVLRNLMDFAVRMISDVAVAGQNLYWSAAVNLMGMAASGLFLLSSYGKKIFGECISRFGGCFVAGTPIVVGTDEDPLDKLISSISDVGVTTCSKTQTRAIEAVELGSRVITEAPDWLPRDSEFGEPSQATWKQINILQQRGDGTVIEMELLRPSWWIDLLGLKVGAAIELPFPELETVGLAKVLSFSACPPIQDGEGEVVIGRFVTRQASNLMKVSLMDGTSFIGTDTHKIWSADALDWRRIDELSVGDGMESLHRIVRVRSVQRYNVTADVYNIEVANEHVYRVLESGILVHNMDYTDAVSGAMARGFSEGALALKKLIKEAAALAGTPIQKAAKIREATSISGITVIEVPNVPQAVAVFKGAPFPEGTMQAGFSPVVAVLPDGRVVQGFEIPHPFGQPYNIIDLGVLKEVVPG